jgi:hypothetical protein
MSGHDLLLGGTAFDNAGYPFRWEKTAGEGRAKCSCGVLSEWLHSGAERKRWHKEHKAQVIA